MKVHIVERLATSIGNTLLVKNDRLFRIGDSIQGDDGRIYTIKKIIMPSIPANDNLALVVE